MFLFLLSSGLKDDVDVVASEFAGETDVLALLADSDGLLIFGNVDFGFLAIDINFHDFGGTEGFTDIFGSVVAPVDDIDFLAVTNFVHDGADTDTASTDESTDWIDAGYG